MNAPRIAIVGAGIAGTACAHALIAGGRSVRLFDKGRRAGGRISTRRADELTFDHGAQYFTARTSAFQERVQTWADDGFVAPWTGALVALSRDGEVRPVSDELRRWVGTPTMSALATATTRGLDVITELRITSLVSERGAVTLEAEDGSRHGPFVGVVLAVPAEQAATLLHTSASAATDAGVARAMSTLADLAGAVDMAPCVAAMLAFDAPTELPFDGAFVDDDVLAWIAKDSSKPGRSPTRETWVLHATPSFSREYLDGPADAALPMMLAAFARVAKREAFSPVFTTVHRWRYARSAEAKDVGETWSEDARVGLCGDWCAGDRVEGAFTSGSRLAARILAWRG